MGDRELYSDDGIFGKLDYGSPGVSRGLVNAAFIVTMPVILYKPNKVLVIGGGNNYETIFFNKHSIKTFAVDFRIPRIKCLRGKGLECDAKKLPFHDNEFNLVFCTEMMEHVHVDETDDILMEAKRVAKQVYFTIATKGDSPYNTHINVHDGIYWIEKFKEIGFNINTAMINPTVYVNMNGAVMGVSYPDGVLIYADC